MHTRKMVLGLTGIIVVVLALLLLGLPVAAGGPFVEPEVIVIHDIAGEPQGGLYGWAGGDIGDLDGDGAHEFVVSDPVYSGTAASQGKVYIYSGDDAALVESFTGSAGELFGYGVYQAGDVNNDGTPDYIVGAAGGNEGRAVVYSGADHSVIWEFADPDSGSSFGSDVAGAGDVNGDGYDDVIVGASTYSVTQPLEGKVFVYSGESGDLLWERAGAGANDGMGAGVGPVGDVNGDGVVDVATGAAGANNLNGEAYVLSGTDGEILRTMRPVEPFSPTQTFGVFFASDAGDVNNDGIPDVFVGDYAATTEAGNRAGRAYIFSGAEGAPLLHLLEGEDASDGFGPGRGAGDVNGDGYDDVVVASYLDSDGGASAGKMYLFSGADGSVLHTATGTEAGLSLGVDALPVGDVNDDGELDYLLTGFGRVYVISFAEAPSAVTLTALNGRSVRRVYVPAAVLLFVVSGGLVVLRRRNR